ELWLHFSQPGAWRCLEGVGETLTALERRGLVLGVASNFDSRLRSVVAGLPELCPLRQFVISSEVGWGKPAAPFFRAVIGTAGAPPEHILFVGDDPVNDDEGARAAGLKVVLLDPCGNLRTSLAGVLSP